MKRCLMRNDEGRIESWRGTRRRRVRLDVRFDIVGVLLSRLTAFRVLEAQGKKPRICIRIEPLRQRLHDLFASSVMEEGISLRLEKPRRGFIDWKSKAVRGSLIDFASFAREFVYPHAPRCGRNKPLWTTQGSQIQDR